MNKKIYKRGFNVAELLVVVVILGVITAIVLSAAINNYEKVKQSFRLQRAMKNYETALRTMQIKTMAKSMDAINANMGKNCSNIKEYFRVVIDDGCTFMTNDKMWYQFQSQGNVPSANLVIVAFDRRDLKSALDDGDYAAFLFVTEMKNDELQINNPRYKSASDLYRIAVTKTYRFANYKNK